MTVQKCLMAKAKAGKLSEDAAEKLVKELDRETLFTRGEGASNPEAVAAKRVLEAAREKARIRKRARLSQMKIQVAVTKGQDAAEKKKRGGAFQFAMHRLDSDPRRGQTGVSVMQQSEILRDEMWRQMDKALDEFKVTPGGLNFGNRRRTSMDNMGREMSGEKTGNPAAVEMAEGAANMLEYGRKKFNAAGGTIGKTDNYLPQRHNGAKMARVTAEVWADRFLPKLNLGRMIDRGTGLPWTQEALRNYMINTSYPRIVSGGLNEIQPGGGGRVTRSILATRSQERFFHFKDYDSWKAYNKEFGDGDLWQTLMGHVQGLAHDIAILENLGAVPSSTIELMKANVSRLRSKEAIGGVGKKAIRAQERLRDKLGGIDSLWASVSGDLSRPENMRTANGFAIFRGLMTSAKLGSAVIPAASVDPAFAFAAAFKNGMPMMKTMARAYQTIFTLKGAERRALAQRIGYINESALGFMNSQQRYIGEVIGPNVVNRVVDTVLRTTGLNMVTQASRSSWYLEFLGAITDDVGKGFAQLSPRRRAGFESVGLTSKEWDALRTTPLFVDAETGATFLDLQGFIGAAPGARQGSLVADTGRAAVEGPDVTLRPEGLQAALKISQLIRSESISAVPFPTARVRALVTAGSRPGTLAGETARGVFQFKSFTMGILMNQINFVLHGNLSKWDRFKYAATLFIATTVLGGFALQLRQLKDGKNPLDMTTTKFWLAANLQGGGSSLFGDFFFSDVNRFGRTVAQEITGPGIGAIDDIRKATVGNIGEAKNVTREAMRAVGNVVPGSSQFYFRLVPNRLLIDMIEEMTDPTVGSRRRRLKQRMLKEKNQTFFFPPGGPVRLPDLSEAIK